MRYLFVPALSAFIAGMAISPRLFAAEPAVSGVFTGDGKAAKMAFLSARKGEPFSDKETIVLIFSEKDHSKDKRPDFKAAFCEFGSALIITVLTEDGSIIGCQVAHTAHKQKPFNSIGKITMSDFKIADGQVQGKLSTDGKVETFEQTWAVDLKFRTKAP
ncbi:MAG: hypothetical protein ACR2OZ_03945 [Verrucomicrobiales bacterium]